MRSRKHYDSTVPILYALGKERILPDNFRKSIPASTASSWRNHPPELVGSEFRPLQSEAWDRQEILIKHQRLKFTVTALIKVWTFIHSFIKPNFYKPDFKDSKALFVFKNIFKVVWRFFAGFSLPFE